MVHVAKFYAWLEINETTPIDVKLLVWDCCVLCAILYACECWGDLSFLEKYLVDMETKALKTILKVKSGTTNDLIYHELRRPTIMARIKDRQYRFFKRLNN